MVADRVLPTALQPGDRVAVVSPCGPVLDHDLFDASIAILRSWDLEVVEGAHARASTGHLAGTDGQRVADLNAAFADPSVRAVWIARGGYGLTRILDRIAWDALTADPKLVVGFSDVTALLVAAWQRVGMVAVHGPFVGRLAQYPLVVVERVRRLVLHDADTDAVADAGSTRPVQLTGTAVIGGSVGPVPLVGGNLTVLAALAGTTDQVRASGCVLLVEEVAEAPYRVDRALTQLRASGSLDGVAGVAVGAPVACVPTVDRPSATFAEVVADRLGGLGRPVVAGLPVGHTRDQHALLHGGRVTLDGSHGTLMTHDRLPRARRRRSRA